MSLSVLYIGKTRSPAVFEGRAIKFSIKRPTRRDASFRFDRNYMKKIKTTTTIITYLYYNTYATHRTRHCIFSRLIILLYTQSDTATVYTITYLGTIITWKSFSPAVSIYYNIIPSSALSYRVYYVCFSFIRKSSSDLWVTSVIQMK